MAASPAATEPATSITQVAAQFLRPIQCATWRRDGQQLALVASGSSEIEVWSLLPGLPAGSAHDVGSKPQQQQSLPQWARSAVLRGHEQGQPISALDWNNENDLLVSCSHDRNAYIWRQDRPGGASHPPGCEMGSRVLGAPGWSRQLVETSLKKGCLCVQWCPLNKNKLAIGSASKVVAIAFFDKELGWWSSLQLRAASGSCTCLAWHPHTHLLAVGSTEGYVRLFHAGTDTDPPLRGSAARATAAAAGGGGGGGGGKPKFGQLVCCVVPTDSGWVHTTSWLPSGAQLLFASHASQVHACDLWHMLQQQQPHTASPPTAAAAPKASREAAGAEVGSIAPSVSTVPIQPSSTLRLPGCRVKSLLVLGEDLAVAGGWDGVLLVLARALPPEKVSSGPDQQGLPTPVLAREDDTARVPDTAARGVVGPAADKAPAKRGATGASMGVWSLRYMLGRFVPGETPPMAPEFLMHAASHGSDDTMASLTPPRVPLPPASDSADTACESGGVAQRLRQLSLQREKASPGLISRAPSLPPPSPASMSARAGQGQAAHEAQAWRQVLAASRPAHDTCITALARPRLPWHSPFLTAAPGSSTTTTATPQCCATSNSTSTATATHALKLAPTANPMYPSEAASVAMHCVGSAPSTISCASEGCRTAVPSGLSSPAPPAPPAPPPAAQHLANPLHSDMACSSLPAPRSDQAPGAAVASGGSMPGVSVAPAQLRWGAVQPVAVAAAGMAAGVAAGVVGGRAVPSGEGQQGVEFASCGLDGKVLLWRLPIPLL